MVIVYIFPSDSKCVSSRIPVDHVPGSVHPRDDLVQMFACVRLYKSLVCSCDS